MSYLSIKECQRIYRIASAPDCGSAHRADISAHLRNAAVARQNDPNADPDELLEITGMLLALGESP